MLARVCMPANLATDFIGTQIRRSRFWRRTAFALPLLAFWSLRSLLRTLALTLDRDRANAPFRNHLNGALFENRRAYR